MRITPFVKTTMGLLAMSGLAIAREWRPGDPCPDRIITRIPGGEPHCGGWNSKCDIMIQSTETIHNIMLTCPNITELTMRIGSQGCTDHPDRYDLPFDPRGGERYASAPEVLALGGYNFGSQEQRKKANIDLWLDAMDFSRIHTLRFDWTDDLGSSMTPEVTQKLPPVLSNLRSLSVQGRNGSAFILALPPASLDSLTWKNPERQQFMTHFHAVLGHHGASLRSFDFHVDESLSFDRPVLTVGQLASLAKLAPKVTDLAVDIPRNASGEWPWAELRALASHPTVQNLTLYMDFASACRRQKSEAELDWRYRDPEGDACGGSEQYAKPEVNPETAREVFRFLRAEKAGLPLQRVTLRSGDWTPGWEGPLYFPSWLEGQSRGVECRLDENGEALCATEKAFVDGFGRVVVSDFADWDDANDLLADEELYNGRFE